MRLRQTRSPPSPSPPHPFCQGGRAHRPASLFHQRVAHFELESAGKSRSADQAPRTVNNGRRTLRFARGADLGGGWGRLFWRDKRQGAKYRRVMHWKSPASGSQLKAVASLLLVAAWPSTAPAAGEVVANLHRLAPSVVHDAETCIVPAAVGARPIRPHGLAPGHDCATLIAFVRT